VKSASRFPVPTGVVQLARNSMPAMRDNSAGVGREVAWEVCESWVVMGREKFVLSPGCDHAQTFLFARSILANPRPDSSRSHLDFLCSSVIRIAAQLFDYDAKKSWIIYNRRSEAIRFCSVSLARQLMIQSRR
jgi:hypothetical protein